MNETVDFQAGQPLPSHADVAAQYAASQAIDPNFSPVLLEHMQGWATQEAGALPPADAGEQIEVYAATRAVSAEADQPRQEISDEHHAEHVSLAKLFDPNIEQRPAAQQDLIGEIIEIGSEATSAERPAGIDQGEQRAVATLTEQLRTACDTRDQAQLETAVDSLRDAHDNYSDQVVDSIAATYRKLTSDNSMGRYELERSLGNRPQLVEAIIARSQAGNPQSDWDKLASQVMVSQAISAIARKTEQGLRFNSNPFEDPVEVQPGSAEATAIATDHARAAGLTEKAGNLALDQRGTTDAITLLGKYGAMAEAGVSLGQVNDYESLARRGTVDDYPTSEKVVSTTEAVAAAPTIVREFIKTNNGFNLEKMLANADLTTALAAELDDRDPAEQQVYLARFIEVSGSNSWASDEMTAQARAALQDCQAAGASMAGMVDIIGSSRYIEAFDQTKQLAEKYDTVDYQASLALLSRLSHMPELINGYGGGTGDLSNNRLLRGALGQPQHYGPALDVVEAKLGDVIASGYPAELAIDAGLSMFSPYAGNRLNAYHEDSLAAVHATHLNTQYQAMELVGASTEGIIATIGEGGDRFTNQLGYDLYRHPDEQLDAANIRSQLTQLSEQLMSIADQPQALELLHKITVDQSLDYDVASIQDWQVTAELVQDAGPNCANYLIDHKMVNIVANNLDLFNDLDAAIGLRMIDSYRARDVLTRPELFAGLELDQALADRIQEHGGAIQLVNYLDKFHDVDRLAVAGQIIAGGNGLMILYRLDQFPGIENMTSDAPEVQRFVAMINDEALNALVGDAGPLYTMANQIRTLYLESENPQGIISRMQVVCSGDSALWRSNHEYAQMLVGEVGDVGYLDDYQISAVPFSLPRGDITLDAGLPPPLALATMDADTKRSVLSQAFLDAHPETAELEQVSFTDLNPDYQDSLLAYRLYETVRDSRDPAAQAQATTANRQFADAGNYWQRGDLVHATGNVIAFRNILQSGMFCGETLGMNGRRDSYPFNVDTVAISDDVLAGTSHAERLDALKNSHYGSIAMLLHRTNESTDFGRETSGGMNADHRLVFGGVASTEISAVLLRNADQEMTQSVIDSVIDNGVYMAVVDQNGQKLLAYNDYLAKRADGNYDAVKPRAVDSSFKREGTQAGSNEGALFIVPSAQGMQQHYVKFGDVSAQKRDHLWTELLTDSLYRQVTPELVPLTEAVTIEGRLARASQLVPLAEQTAVTNQARNTGFIMDCFTGNWDAVYNSANLVMSTDGQAMRIDTGNSLDFQARGDKKADDAFGPVVREVANGTDAQDLGGGMRQMYPGLTDAMVREQVAALRDRLSEADIDQLVNSVRRSTADRQNLADILKNRRQNLINTFLK